jgi:hypothetical protein
MLMRMKTTTRTLTILSLTSALALSAHAMFMRPDVENVPTDRLLANLEAKAKETPRKVEVLYAVARVHAIAYAQNQAQFQAHRNTGLPFFGFVDRGFLPKPKPESGRGASNHLAQAIEWYTKALAADTNHLASRIGLGWCQEQAGDKQQAIATYRGTLDAAWAKEKTSGHIFESSVASEVAKYMLPLLDPKTDADEIQRVQDIKNAADRLPRAITPILVPLADDLGLDQMVNPRAGVTFDLDGSGRLLRWGWPTAKAGWLVYDPAGKGEIRSGLQLIGAVTFWVFWANGYEALGALDDNHDGWLRGDELKGLAVWCDANGNGRSEPGEVFPVERLGIRAIACGYQRHGTGIPFRPAGIILNDGRTRPTYDWITTGW